jgi:hypothetical protein
MRPRLRIWEISFILISKMKVNKVGQLKWENSYHEEFSQTTEMNYAIDSIEIKNSIE